MEKRSAPDVFHLGYKKSLDGVRGVAILMVIAFHAKLAGDYFGFLGVDLFFVLSGFLITCLLVEEWNTKGSISLKNFYIRRAARLLPALFLVLISFVSYTWITGSNTDVANSLKEAILALFYLTNWARAFEFFSPYALAHTWSLSIEEQFYLLWPLLLFLLLRNADRKSVVYLIFLGAFVLTFYRFFFYTGFPVTFTRLFNGLDTRADALLIGCSSAICISSQAFSTGDYLKGVLRVLTFVSIAALCYIGFAIPIYGSIGIRFGWSAVSACCAIILLQLATSEAGLLKWFLEIPPLVFIGRISYGLYLWHNPVFLILRTYEVANWPYVSIPIVLALTLLSYYLVELPCLRLKKRFEFRSNQ